MNVLDGFLNSVTMYRLILYYLIGLLITALLFSILNILPFNPLSLIFSTLFVTVVCWAANKVFSDAFDAPTNIESVYISALILALIISPITSFQDAWLFFWAGILTMASKYIFAIHKKHIFNPVAIAVVLTSIGFNGSASWWVGTLVLSPFVFIGGFLIVRKIRREDLVFSFLGSALAAIIVFTIFSGGNIFSTIQNLLLNSSLLFLAFVMLTEPLTTPPTKNLQIAYGTLVGFLFAPQINIAGIFSTPELALCIGNIFSYIVSPKYKLLLRLKEKIQYGTDILDFHFSLDQKLAFAPGQYMEWTVPHDSPDSRGNRRYFTIASSPTENTLQLGVKFYPNGSSLKKTLANLDVNTPIVGAQLAGDFTLPKDPQAKCVFIAGGIGITPFRSMIKYLIDTNEPRPLILFFANKVAGEIVYADVFEQARAELGIKTVYTLTDQNAIPQGWQGRVGRVNAQMIQQEVPDYLERVFYLSGPHQMINGYEKILREMGIKDHQIKKDFFPGFV
jgi:ferredoxin-NADP reductase/Na+-translocating ferredoxin:NAD+ oxidoreductase RnfD subunit